MLKILITILDPLVIGYEFISILGDLYDHFMCTSHILLSNYMMLLFKEIKLWLKSPTNLELFVGIKIAWTLSAHELM